jgi:hypothetical protein
VGDLGEVVAALLAARDRIGRIADEGRASRGKIAEAAARFEAVIRGSADGNVLVAADRWRRAEHHLDLMIGRLLTGAMAIDEYVRAIAPGASGSSDVEAGRREQAEPPVSGQRLLDESQDAGTRMDRFQRLITAKGDDAVDATKSTAQAIRALTHRDDGSAQVAHTEQPVFQARVQPASVPDLLTGVVTAAIVGVTGTRAFGRLIRRLRERRERGDDE